MRNEDQIQCMVLLNVLTKVVEANSGKATDSDRGWYAEGLVNKFYDHAFFILKMSGGATSLVLPSGTITISGGLSQDVLVRAAFEAYLVFHYVYCIPKTQEDKELKHLSYKLAGVMDRKDFPVTTEEQRATLDKDKQVIQELSGILNSNSSFQNMKQQDRKSILNGKWRLQSWAKMAEESRLSGLLASDAYRYLCGVAHSSSLSVFQNKLAYEKHETKKMMGLAVNLLNILIANMVYDYCELFSSSKDALDKDEAGIKLVNMWVAIGRELGKNNSTGKI